MTQLMLLMQVCVSPLSSKKTLQSRSKVQDSCEKVLYFGHAV
jgi:hypothetical protein